MNSLCIGAFTGFGLASLALHPPADPKSAALCRYALLTLSAGAVSCLFLSGACKTGAIAGAIFGALAGALKAGRHPPKKEFKASPPSPKFVASPPPAKPLPPPDCPKREAQLIRLKEWKATHGNDFLAHGVWPSNEKAVLTDGRLRCGENVLRRDGKLEFEGGSAAGSRETLYFPDNFSAELLEATKKEAEELFQLSDKKIEENLIKYDKALNHLEQHGNEFRLSDDDETILPPEEGKACRAKHFQEKGMKLGEALFKKSYYGAVIRELDEKNELWKEHQKPRWLYIEAVLSIFIDQALPKEKRLKSELARIYQVYERLLSEKKINLTQFEIGALLEGVRRTRVLGPVKITNEIRAYRNRYEGCYGNNLKILIGDPESVSGPPSFASECYLLSNAQNKGKFFKVDLSSPNVLILGSKKSLMEFADDPRFGKNIIFLENLPKDWLACPTQ